MVCPGGIAESNTRKAISTFPEFALFESNIFPVVDNKCGPVVVLLESEAAVKKTNIPDMTEVPCVGANGPHAARKPLIVFSRVQ